MIESRKGDPDDSRLANAIAEYVELEGRGAAPSVSEFADRHHSIAGALRTCLQALSSAAEAPGACGPTPAFGRPALEIFGDFKIIRTIGRGGMGVVYEAEQVSLPRRVALKVLPPGDRSDPDRLRRFRQEIETTASLQHPNIVPVFEAGEVDGLPYYAMPLLEGRSMDRVIAAFRSEPKTVPLASRDGLVAWIARFIDVARALATAHRAGIVHRDIKPSNLYLSTDGRLLVLDFGLNRATAPGRLTQTGAPVGTPRYMSPEQILFGKMPVDGRSDVFGLAATLYEVLVQVPAFDGDSVDTVFRQILSKEPVVPRRIDPRMPDDLEAVLMKALEKDPALRYESADDFADDLLRFLEYQPVRAKPASFLRRLRTRSRGNPALVATVAIAALAVAGAGVAVAWQSTKRTRLAERFLSQAIDFQEYGNLTDARKVLEAALALDPDNSRIVAMLDTVRAAAKASESEAKTQAAVDQADAEIGLAREAVERSQIATARIDDFSAQLRAARGQLLPWDPPPSRARAQAIEKDLEKARRERDDAFEDVLEHVELAKRIAPGSQAIETFLQTAVQREFASAERERDEARVRSLEILVRGQLGEKAIEASLLFGSVSFESTPPGAEVHLFRYEETASGNVAPLPFSLVENGLVTGAPAPPAEPWLALRVARSPRPSIPPPLEAGDVVTTVCGMPPRSLDWTRSHLAQPHRHVLQVRRAGEAYQATVEPGDYRTLAGEIERRAPAELACLDANRAGRTPTGVARIPRGSYLALVCREGSPAALCPFEILGAETETVTADLPRAEDVGPGFVHVPAGPLVVGGDHESMPDERPLDTVVPAFSIARREVTFGEYREFLSDLAKTSAPEATARMPRGASPGSRLGELVNLDQIRLAPPGGDFGTALVGVSKTDAEAYCRWLTAKDGRPGVTFRLPTEAEWERAARGADARRFVWGDRMDWTYARLGLSAPETGVLPTGLYPADESVFGALDMNGNAREWCTLDEGSAYGVLKGGSFASRLEADASLASRAHVRPADWTDESSGFRVVKVVTPPKSESETPAGAPMR